MTMKEQERKALEQIKNIVASLGEDSYIGTAFEGCFEIAEANINNDWACSMQQNVQARDKQIAILQEEYHALAVEKTRIAAESNDRKARIDRSIKELENATKQNQELSWRIKDLEEDLAGMTGLLKKKDEVIMQLKARLYDLLVG